VIRQIFESLLFAYQALKSNVMRTTLSLLGVSVGIFAIVAVFTAVDSLNKKIRDDIDSVAGSGVIYVGKWPWIMANNYPWWKFLNRPEMKYSEYKFLKENLKNAQSVVIYESGRQANASNKSSSMNVSLNGASYEINQTTKIPVTKGRYFMPFEAESGMLVAIIGAEVAENLGIDDLSEDQAIKINGIKFKVIGIIEKKGEDAISIGGSPDQMVYIPYVAFAKIFQKDRPSPEIVLKAFETDINQEKLEAEVTGLLRSLRSIKPKQESDFSVNRLDGLNQFFDTIFSTLNIAGALIAGFSLLVGGFGIANIMFVSVKERTNIIGIQKSLGAKNYFILFQFLFEAVFLSLIGGVVGLFLVFLITLIPQEFLPMSLSIGNMTKGLLISSVIGVLSGIVPAWFAAKLDPVIAIRSK